MAATTMHLHVEPLLDVTQVLVHGADEIGEPGVVHWLECELARCDGCVQYRTTRALTRTSTRSHWAATANSAAAGMEELSPAPTSRPRSEFGMASVISTLAN